jgi:SAM-dependent methyltransferase
MPTLMESKTAVRQHALIKTVLVEQTKSLGRLEIPLVEDLLRKSRCRTVLDIGCGEGSFLLQLADKVKGARFLGIDHNERAINDARRRLRRRPQGNVKFGAAFFNSGFADDRYDAVLTRYTLSAQLQARGFPGRRFREIEEKGPVRGHGVARCLHGQSRTRPRLGALSRRA